MLLSTIANRIIEIVEHKTGGNKSAFARAINVTPAYISKFATKSDALPSDMVIASICSKFGVNERWLRYGEGEMFKPETQNELERIVTKNNLSPEYALVIDQLLNLPPDMQDAVVKMVIGLANAIQDQQAKETPSQRDARLLREEADAVEQDAEKSSASRWQKDA